MKLFAFLSRISKTAYLIAFITLVIRTGFFMSLPFLAVYLARDGIMTAGQIGLVIGISGLVFSVTSLFNGLYVDRQSPNRILMVSLFLAGLSYFALAWSMKVFYLLLCVNAALGWFRSLADISSVSLVAATTKKEDLAYAYSLRFIAINLGLVFGPLLGAVMANQHSLFIFYIAGAIHIVVSLCLLIFGRKHISHVPKVESTLNFLQNFQELWKDKILINLTVINFIMWVAYSQMDSTIPQFVTKLVANPAILVSEIMVVNALVCVLFQPFIMRWAEQTSFKRSGVIGSLLFAVTFVLIGFYPTKETMLIASGMLSLGELFTLPINGLIVMRAAPRHLMGSYNGLISLSLLGLSVGPIIGGYGLQYLGGKTLFLLISLLPLVVMWRYIVSIPGRIDITQQK